MKQKFKFLGIILLILSFNSCEYFDNEDISEEDIVNGLKTALEMGTDTACTDLNKKDGYYGNAIVKILLPPEAEVVYDVMDNPTVQSLGLDDLLQNKIDSVILSVNRAAEDVADDAKPIFIDAITNMTIADGINILNGENTFTSSPDSSVEFDSLAATHYMEYMTREKLFTLYEPKIETALDKDLGLGFSANDAWNTLLYFYNDYLTAYTNLTPIEEVDLSEYSANKGLDGLFYFVGNQERAIRDDPYKWGKDIIEKVFGYVYEE